MNLNTQRLKLGALSLLKLLPLPLLRLLPIGALVNTENIKSSVKRMFRNSPSEILGELFQNSARAGAKLVAITTRAAGFTVSDDGTGVEGVKGFQALLKIAETKYQRPGVAQEHPLGVGLMSLLSHSSVRSVTFISGNLELTVETGKWFGPDEGYARTWFDRLRTRPHRTQGLTISVECEPGMVGELRDALKPRDSRGEFSPAQGYAGTLEITLDGAAVETRLPRWAQMAQVVVETTYEGSRLTIGFRADATHSERTSSVVWYGQVIPIKFDGPFDFRLDVKSGRPVEPRAPSREGLVESDSYHRLLAFVTDQIFSFIFDPKNRARVTPAWVSACFTLDRRRALRESPYYVVRTLLPHSGAVESEDYLDTVGDDALFAYDDPVQPLLLESGVYLALGDQFMEDPHGLCTFLGMTGPAYRLALGDEKRLIVGQLWWKPGAHIKEFFYEPGVWGVGRGEDEPAEWHPVTADNVFCFSQPANWNVGDAEFTAAATDQITFLNVYAWSAFSADHMEASPNELRESYDSSISAMVRKLLGYCVSTSFTVQDVLPFFERAGSRVDTINFVYGALGGTPDAIRATSQHGETVELKLVA